jgi:PPOX class probable FMN-dependent enzyme
MTYVPDPDYAVTTEDALVDIVGLPRQLIAEKVTPYVTPLIRQFIMSSPYFLLATADDRGRCDCTPRGDPTGTVYFPDERTLVIADRKGNRRVDSMRNILVNPHVGLMFLVPGTDETVRVNGTATISRDPALCEKLAIQGKPAELVIVVTIEEVFTHCARAILRSKLWEPESWPDTDTIPTLAAMLAEQKHLDPPDESAGKRNEEYRQVLY